MPALRSMTGYGKGEASAPGLGYSVQVKSVNNRFLELGLKLPSSLWAFEADARALLQAGVSRGKVELHWRETPQAEAALSAPVLDLERAKAWRAALEGLATATQSSLSKDADAYLRLPGVLGGEEVAAEDDNGAARWACLREAMAAALKDLQASREREGKALETELRSLLKRAAELAQSIETQSDGLKAQFAEKVAKRMAQILEKTQVDEARVAQEAALLVDKADIREEVVRFGAHVAEALRLLNEGGAVGKRLDFLCQELLREANTMGSKSPDATLTQAVVSLKSEIEKMKEQVQNLE